MLSNYLMKPLIICGAIAVLTYVFVDKSVVRMPEGDKEQILRVEFANEKPLYSDLFGVNGNLIGINKPWSDVEYISAYSKLNATLVRYPGGTIANNWNWFKGREGISIVENNSELIKLSDEKEASYTLSNLLEGYKNYGFEVVYVLNMVTSTLEEQVSMLHLAKGMGLPVNKIELGNEFYYCISERVSLACDVFPSSSEYIKKASKWSSIIKREFPKVKISAVVEEVRPGKMGERAIQWNSDINQLIRDDKVDAVSLHLYLVNDLTTRYADFSIQPESINAMIVRQFKNSLEQMIKSTIDSLDLLPNSEVWVTEFNIMDKVGILKNDSVKNRYGAIRNRWAQGILIALYYDAFLSEDRIKVGCFHNVMDSGYFGALLMQGDGKYSTSVGGGVLSLFASTARNALSVKQMLFFNLITGEKAETIVSGWRFLKNKGVNDILINYSNNPIRLLYGNIKVRRVAKWSANLNMKIDKFSEITTECKKENGYVLLPPYSIVLILNDDDSKYCDNRSKVE